MNHLPESYFKDYDAFTEHDIMEVTADGIRLRNSRWILFAECAENFKKAHPNSSGSCVGEREISDLSFTFYANSKPVMIKFLPYNRFIEFFRKDNAAKRFHTLQQKIEHFGYSMYDLS